MNLPDLLPALVKAYAKRKGISPAKTKLLKLAYLTEIEYSRNTGRRLLEEDWVYYHFGPYIFSYEDALRSKWFDTEEGDADSGHRYTSIKLSEEAFELPEVDFDTRNAIDHVIRDFADLDLNDILDHVYFDTEPMMAVSDRGDRLDMSTVKPADYYRIKEYKISNKSLAELKKKYKEKGKKLRAAE